MRVNKKILCIKDTIGFKEWEIYNDSKWYICNIETVRCIHTVFHYKEWRKYPDYFQEVKEEQEEKIPRWKVWDYVVLERNWYKWYYKICYICVKDTDIEYISISEWWNWYTETDFRDPTQQELKKYFR